MYITAKLLKGFSKPLIYKIPKHLEFEQNFIGKIIKVPIKNQKMPAIVINQYEKIFNKFSFEIKEILEIEKYPQDINFNTFIKKISNLYFIDYTHLYKRIRNFLLQKTFI